MPVPNAVTGDGSNQSDSLADEIMGGDARRMLASMLEAEANQ